MTSAMISLYVTFQVIIYREYKQEGTSIYKISDCRKNMFSKVIEFLSGINNMK